MGTTLDPAPYPAPDPERWVEELIGVQFYTIPASAALPSGSCCGNPASGSIAGSDIAGSVAGFDTGWIASPLSAGAAGGSGGILDAPSLTATSGGGWEPDTV